MATLTTAANAIATVIQGPLVRGIWTNDRFFGLFPQEASKGGSAYNWHLMTSGVAGGTTTEGAPFRAVDANAYSRPTLTYRLYDATIEITDHLKAAMNSSPEAYMNALAKETEEALAGVKDAVMAQWLGTSVEGILLAVDSTGTYAGLSHSAVTGWNSVEDTTSAALSYAMLDDMRESLRDNEHVARPDLIVSPENQVSNYTRLSGPGVRNNFGIMTASGSQPNADIGENVYDAKFGGMPWVGMPDFDDNTVMMLQSDCMKIVNHERTPGDKGWSSELVPRGGFTQQFSISYFGLLVCEQPFKCGKLSAVTA